MYGYGYGQQETKAYIVLGITYRLDNYYQKAIQHYEKPLELAKNQGYKKEEAKGYFELRKTYTLVNQNTAIQRFENGSEIVRKEGYKLQKAQRHFQLGNYYRLDNKNETAIQHCRKTLEIAMKQSYEKLEANAKKDFAGMAGRKL